MDGGSARGRMIASLLVAGALLSSGCSDGGAELEAGACITDPLAELMDPEDIDPTEGLAGLSPEVEVVSCNSSGEVVRLVEEVGPMVMDDQGGFEGDDCPEGSRDSAVAIVRSEGGQAERWCVEEV